VSYYTIPNKWWIVAYGRVVCPTCGCPTLKRCQEHVPVGDPRREAMKVYGQAAYCTERRLLAELLMDVPHCE